MARNIKEKSKKGKGRKNFVSISLDPESKMIWDRCVNRENMSDWVREQLLYHFKGYITADQKEMLLKEEIFILAKQRDQKIEDINRKYNRLIIEKKKHIEMLNVEVSL